MCSSFYAAKQKLKVNLYDCLQVTIYSVIAQPMQLCGNWKKRKRFSDHELKVLVSLFDQNSQPSPQEVEEVSFSLGLDPVTVKRWFYNRYHCCKAKMLN